MSPTSEPTTSPLANRLRNFLLVLVAIALTFAVFLGLRTETPTATLSELAENAVPLETAIANDNPTLIEFYANWCTACQAMAGDMGELKQTYGDRANFVMLNVDNSKWLPEMVRYRVDGIPHFVFLDASGEAIAEAIGEVPRSIMAENLEALVAGTPLPHAKATGQQSPVEAPFTASSTKSSTDPRSHSSQVQE